MNWIRTIIISSMILQVGCSTTSIDVSHDYDPSYNFTKLKTYDWIPNPVTKSQAELIEKHVRKATEDRLTEKGFSIDNKNPDFYIALHAGRERKIDISNRGYGYRGGINVYEYQEGTLVLDIVDSKNKGLIYRGVANAELRQSDTFEKRQERIKEAVNKILEQFPPVGKK